MEPLQPIQSQPVSNLPPENIAPINQYNGTASPNGNHKKVGPIVAALVVILLVVIAALYMLSSKVKTPDLLPSNNNTAPIQSVSSTNNSQPAEETVAPISSNADDLQSLQNDLDQSITGVDAQAI